MVFPDAETTVNPLDQAKIRIKKIEGGVDHELSFIIKSFDPDDTVISLVPDVILTVEAARRLMFYIHPPDVVACGAGVRDNGL